MSDYTLADIQEELDKLQLENTSLPSNEFSLLESLKSTISRLMTADPDTVFALMLITKQTIESLIASANENIVTILAGLSEYKKDAPPVSASIFDAALALVPELQNGSLAKRKLILQELQKKITSSVTEFNINSGPGTKSYYEVVHQVIFAIDKVMAQVARIQLLAANFLETLTNYFNNTLVLTELTQQSVVLEARLKELAESGATNKLALVLAMASGLLDERLVKRSPTDPKYTGLLVPQAGSAATVTGTKGLPQALPVNDTINISVDGDATPSANIKVPSSGNGATAVTPKETKEINPGTDDVYVATIWPYEPSTNLANFALVVDNTLYAVSVTVPGGGFADIPALATALSLAFVAVGVPAVVSEAGGKITITSNARGTNSRIAFLDTASPPVNNGNINKDFGFLWSFGNRIGTDTTFADLVVTANTQPVLTHDKTIVWEGTPVWSWDGTNNTIRNPTGVVVGDVVYYEASTLLVKAINGTIVTLEGPKLATFDGTTLEDVTSPTDIPVVIRKGTVSMTSPTSVEGTTALAFPSYSAANSLGFPENFPTDKGVHTSVKLATTQELGSPIRLNDILVANNDTELQIASVNGVKDNNLQLTLAAKENLAGTTNTLVSKDIKIYSLGAWTYRKAYWPIANALDNSIEPNENLKNIIGAVLMGAGGREQAKTYFTAYDDYLDEMSAAFSKFTANVPSSVVQLLKRLGENQFTVVCESLKSLDFKRLYALTEQDLSTPASLLQQVSSLSDVFGTPSGEAFQLVETDDTIWNTGADSAENVIPKEFRG